MITVGDPEMLKHILVKDFDKFRNRPDFMRSNPPLESNLFAARDEQWKKVRSLLTPTFSSSKLKEILPIIEDAANVLVGKLENSADNGKLTTINNYYNHLGHVRTESVFFKSSLMIAFEGDLCILFDFSVYCIKLCFRSRALSRALFFAEQDSIQLIYILLFVNVECRFF